MEGGVTKNLAQLKNKIFDYPMLFNLVRHVLEGGYGIILKLVMEQLQLDENERLLDVGCGTGDFCGVTSGEYAGIDLNSRFINYAKNKHAKDNKKFLAMDGTNMGFQEKVFDKTILLSMLHHLSEDSAAKILTEISRVTKKLVVILDLLPHKQNLIGNFFYAMDRGAYIRSLDKQLKLVRNCLKVEKCFSFKSGVNIHSLMICSPTRRVQEQ